MGYSIEMHDRARPLDGGQIVIVNVVTTHDFAILHITMHRRQRGAYFSEIQKPHLIRTLKPPAFHHLVRV